MILGVDPGLGGALAYLTGDIITIHDMPVLTVKKKRSLDEIELARLIDAMGPIERAYVEIISPRQIEGVSTAATSARNYGVLRGILRAHFIPIIDVPPAAWKRVLGIPSGAGKDASRARAKDLFQRQAELFVRVKDEGRAEAALIAVYGQRQTQAL